MAKGVMYSVVVPVYNGAQTVTELYQRLSAFFIANNYTYELVFVVDASPDKSYEVLTALQQNDAALKIYLLGTNAGQHAATLCGVLNAEGEYIITLDDDLQMPPEEIAKLVARQTATGADMVYGVFSRENHSTVKYIASWFIYRLLRTFLKEFRYISTFRLFKREAATHLTLFYQRYFTLDEVLKYHTPKVAYVPVQHNARKVGKSGYSAFHLFAFMVNYLINYTYIPLRIMLYGGLITALTGFAAALYSFKAANENSILLSIVIACAGLIIMALGLVAEYHVRFLNARIGRPLFIVKERRE